MFDSKLGNVRVRNTFLEVSLPTPAGSPRAIAPSTTPACFAPLPYFISPRKRSPSPLLRKPRPDPLKFSSHNSMMSIPENAQSNSPEDGFNSIYSATPTSRPRAHVIRLCDFIMTPKEILIPQICVAPPPASPVGKKAPPPAAAPPTDREMDAKNDTKALLQAALKSKNPGAIKAVLTHAQNVGFSPSEFQSLVKQTSEFCFLQSAQQKERLGGKENEEPMSTTPKKDEEVKTTMTSSATTTTKRGKNRKKEVKAATKVPERQGSKENVIAEEPTQTWAQRLKKDL